MTTEIPCPRCEGCGQLANDDERTPWTFWANLKPPSNMAVVLGLVGPEPCYECTGTGKAPTPTVISSIMGLAEIIAARPELQRFRDDEWALAHAMACAFQQPDPTAEQCTYFIDDAEACSGDVGPGPYTVTKLGVATRNYTTVVMINGWLCGAEEGEGYIELTTISDLSGWTFTPALRTPEEWCKSKGVQILDADGWRGANGRPWNDPITEAEFDERLVVCTQRSVPIR